MKSPAEKQPALITDEALWQIIQARDQALVRVRDHCEQQSTELEKLSNYLAQVEADRAKRLKSIEFYQDKLQTAYADLERNVAYLKTLETEIANHVKVAAHRDALVADLSLQLQAFKKSSPATKS